MKKLLFSSLCAAALLTACNSEEPVVGPGNNGELGEPQFLTVNLVTNTTGTRAGVAGDPDGALYEKGLEAENEVKKVRFYFFDASGNAANVKKSGEQMVNWLDWTDISVEGDNMPNVEKILSATLVIETPVGDDKDNVSQIVAIINPTNENATAGLSLADLQEKADNYQDGAYTTSGTFVMSNSTYANGGNKMMAVSVAGKLKKTPAEALNDPVQIYVERTVAKVRLDCGLTPIVVNGENLYPTFTAEKPQKVKVNGVEKDIYVKFLGWNTTAVNDKGRLVKDIKADWTFSGWTWNWADAFRSFWAINADGVARNYGAFETTEGTGTHTFVAQANTKFDASQWVYVNENASDDNTGSAPSIATKVIIGAQLVDEDGNEIEFAEYGSTRTTVDGLKTLFANNVNLYWKEVKGEGADMTTEFHKITPDELEVVTAASIGLAEDKENAGRYKSYVQLTADAAKKVWYATNDKDAQPIMIDNESKYNHANEALLALGSAKVWTNGYTYYFFPIQHLGNINGVVRNHIYDANITSLVGLGTPVYNPNEVIYPEKPTPDNDYYIAAQINILSWRIVNNNVSLEW